MGKVGEWWGGMVRGSWFYLRVGNTGCVQGFIFFVSDVNQGNEGMGWIFFCVCAGMERHFLDLPWAVKKLKLALYQTQSGELNYVDHKFLF